MAGAVVKGPRAWDGGMVFFLPFLIWFCLRLPVMSAIGFTDAFYYFAYSDNFHELVERYGFHYYAVRFGSIFPDWLAVQAIGPVWGGLGLRMGLSGAVCVALYRTFARRSSRLTGWFAAAVWAFNPVVIGMMLSPYLTSTAVPFGFLGVLGFYSLRSDSRGTARWSDFAVAAASGCLFALSATSNLFAALMIASGMFGWLIVEGPRVFRLWSEILTSVAGFLGTLGVAVWFYHGAFGMPLILNPTWDIIFSLNAGGAQQWARPMAEWIRDSPQNFAPLAALGISAALLMRFGGSRWLIGAWVAFAGFVALYWFLDLFRGGYSLSFWIYFQFLVPGLTLLAAEFAGRMRDIGGGESRMERSTWLVLLGFITFAIPGEGWRHVGYYLLPIAVLVSCGLILAGRLAPGVRLGWLSVGACIAISGVFSRSHLMNFADSLGFARIGSLVSQMVPKTSEDWRAVLFWYPDESTPLRMVQSAQLFWFSKMRDQDGSAAGYPEVSDGIRDVWKNPMIGRVLLLDENGTERLEKALVGLRDAGLPYHVLERKKIEASGVSVDVVMIEPVRDLPREWSVIQDIRFRARNGAEVGGVLKTSSILWSWDILARLQPRPGPGWLRIRMRVLVGRVGVMVYPERSGPGREATVPRTPGVVDVVLRVTDLSATDQLVFRNAWVRGMPCEFEVESVEWAPADD